MKAQHTPGVWTTSKKAPNAVWAEQEFGKVLICTLDNTMFQSEPNARLITAAPELLDALQALIHANPRGVKKTITDRAKAAIDKATKPVDRGTSERPKT